MMTFNSTISLEVNKGPEYMSNLTNLRLLYHQYVYNDNANIELLKSIIMQNIDTLSCDYDQEKNTISIRIKKTSMKKNSDFEHSTIYYYYIFNNIFRHYLMNTMCIIDPILKDTEYGSINNILENALNVNTMYNLTCMSDNIIMIYL